MQINEFIGNDIVTGQIEAAMADGTVPHAVIIDGAKGTGKAALAKILASYCICTGDKRPCGCCPGCIKASHNSHPDIFTTDGNDPGGLSIEVIRNIRRDAFIMPNEAPSKCFLLLNCDKMLAPAQNAFLKILEEPPAGVMFVMTVSSANMLLQTVRSRSRIYSLLPPEPEQTAGFLSQKMPELSYEDILHTATICSGNIGKTIEMLRSGGEEAARLADDIFAAIASGKEYDLLVQTQRASSGRPFAAAVLDIMTENAAQCLRASAGLPTDSENAELIASKVSRGRVLMLAENISRAREILQTNVNLNFFSTWLSSVLKL